MTLRNVSAPLSFPILEQGDPSAYTERTVKTVIPFQFKSRGAFSGLCFNSIRPDHGPVFSLNGLTKPWLTFQRYERTRGDGEDRT